MKVAIEKDGKEGFVFYNKNKNQIMVNHPDEFTRELVRTYPKSKQVFTLGNSNGGRVRVCAKPTQHIQLMDMALCQMPHYNGVNVNWEHPDNIEDITNVPRDDRPISKVSHDFIIHIGRGSNE